MSNTFSIIFLFLASVLILTCFVDTVSAGAVVDGLIAYWSFDEETTDVGAAIATDSVQGIEGTIKGDPEPVEG